MNVSTLQEKDLSNELIDIPVALNVTMIIVMWRVIILQILVGLIWAYWQKTLKGLCCRIVKKKDFMKGNK